MKESPRLIDNEAAKQYEMHAEGLVVRIEYIKTKDAIYLTHTEVPKALEGKGWGSAIIKATLAEIKEQDIKLVPLCPFVAAYIQKHPEWKSILKPGVNID